jgi:uncharacterized spore protein YtfJ
MTELMNMTQATRKDTSVLETIREVVDGAAAGKVFGAPITYDGLTVLPVAKVSGGGGGGSGTGPAQDGHDTGGSGGGMGTSAKPLGVFVIKEGSVAWRPAVDVNKVIVGSQIVAVAALLTLRALINLRSKRNSHNMAIRSRKAPGKQPSAR